MEDKFFFTKIGRYILGLLIIFVLFWGIIYCTYLWYTTTNTHRQNITFYFQNSVHGLSIGSNIKLYGRDIGQITSITIDDLFAPHKEQNSVRVQAYIDIRKLKKCVNINENSKEEIESLIQKGLHARIILPSITSAGRSIELFWHNPVPNKTNLETFPIIPTIEKRSSDYIDDFNKITRYKQFENLENQIQIWSKNLSTSAKFIQAIDFKQENDKLLSRLNSWNEALNPKETKEKLIELNQKLSLFDTKIKNNNILQEKDEITSSLKKINAQLENISEISKNIQTQLQQNQQFIKFLTKLPEIAQELD